MADIFLSYSQRDKEFARKLADSLSVRGADIWWDTELVGGERFRDVILSELDKATVVIVLWSTNSIASRFVLDEADRAAASGKLLSLLLPDFQARFIPMGFGSFQAIAIDDEERLLKALEARGVLAPTSVAVAQAATTVDPEAIELSAWHFVKDRTDPMLFEEFLGKFANGSFAFLARQRLAELRWEALKGSIDVGALREFAAKHAQSELAALALTRATSLEQQSEAERLQAAALERARLEQDEEEQWKRLQNDRHDPALIHAFLKAFPDGKYAKLARDALAESARRQQQSREAWEKIKESTAHSKLRRFIKDFPGTTEAKLAADKLAALPKQRSRIWKWVAGFVVLAGVGTIVAQVIVEAQRDAARLKRQADRRQAEERRIAAACEEANRFRSRFSDFVMVSDARPSAPARESNDYPAHTTKEQDWDNCAASCRRRTWCRGFDPRGNSCDLYSDISLQSENQCRYWFRKR